MKELEKYQEMVGRGLCAHAAAAACINYAYMIGKEEGLTLEECHSKARAILAEIKQIWRSEP